MALPVKPAALAGLRHVAAPAPVAPRCRLLPPPSAAAVEERQAAWQMGSGMCSGGSVDDDYIPADFDVPRGETAGATLVVEGITVQAGDRDLLTVRSEGGLCVRCGP